jgi:hypothetical protein
MENASIGREEQWKEYHKLHALLRLSMIGSAERGFLRRHKRTLYRALSNRGVGGIAGPGRDAPSLGRKGFVKCLHLQAASYLGIGRHPMSGWLSARISDWECRDGECALTK